MRIKAEFRMLVAVGVAAFLMVASFRKGLYFEQDSFSMQLLLDALGLVVVVTLWLRGELRTFANQLALFLMSVVYLLPLLFTRVSVEGTLEEVMHWGSFSAWLLLISWFAKSQSNRRLLYYAFWGVGLFLGGGMFAGFYGLFHFQDLYLISHDVRFTALGVRFSGFFQYANTFAAVMGAFLLQQLVLLVREKRVIAACLHAFPLVAYGVVILLSESRGAWLVIGGGWLVGLLVLAAKERMGYVLSSIALGCAVLLAYQQFVSSFTRQTSHFPGLLALLLATVLFVLAVVGGQYVHARGLHKRAGSQVLAGVVATVGLLVGGMLLWRSDTLLSRGLHHFESAVARELFYHDAVKMFRDSPWIGWGGLSWRMLFRQYQQYPYVGNEVHSGLISLGLDVGIVGVLVFCLLFIRYLKPLLLSKSLVLPALFVLLGHSLFDVDMSFGFYWYLVLGLIGVELARLEVTRQERAISWARQVWQRHGMAAVTLTVLIGCLVCTVNFEMGNLSYANATRASSEEEASRALQQAIKWNPYSIPYRLELAHHLEKAHVETQALPMLQTGVSFEPHDAVLLWEIGNVYWAMNQPKQMMSYMQAAIQEDRYDTSKQEEYVQRLQQMAKQEYLQGRRQEATQLARQVDVAFTNYVGLDAQLKEMPYRVNDRKFAVTAKAKFDATQAYVLLGQYADAQRLLQALSVGEAGQMQENANFELRLVQDIEARVQQGTLQRDIAYEEYLARQ